MFKFTKHFSTKTTPQREPIPGSRQVPNSAGGYAWAVDDWARLDRFLVLGGEGGTFYVGERELTIENAEVRRALPAADGMRTVDRIVHLRDGTRAQERSGDLFARDGGQARRRGDAARRVRRAPKVCRIGTHLMHFAEYAQGFGGWGRGMRKAVGAGSTQAGRAISRTSSPSTSRATAGRTAICCGSRTRARRRRRTTVCSRGR